jgi:hypothetical protein
MRVCVDDARHDRTATRIEDPRASGNLEACCLAYGYDPTPLDDNDAISYRRPAGAVNDGPIPYYQSIDRHTRIVGRTPGKCGQQQSYAEFLAHPNRPIAPPKMARVS